MTSKTLTANVGMELLKASFPEEIQKRSLIKLSFKCVLIEDMLLCFFKQVGSDL